MKRFFPIVFFLLLFAACDRNTGNAPSISLLDDGNVIVSPAGGKVEIVYGVVNAVDGGTVSAYSDVEWISEPSYDSDTRLSFVVDANGTMEKRSSVITIDYTYGGGTVESKQINLIQSASSYALDATVFTSTYYGDFFGDDGEHRYYTWLSDMPFVNEEPQAGGTYYLFDIYAPAPEGGKPSIPAGTYTIGKPNTTTAMTFSSDYSNGFKTDASGNYLYESVFSEGTLTVSYEGESIVMEAVLLDTEGGYHFVSYSGPTEYIEWHEEDVFPGIQHDIEIEASFGEAVYVAGSQNEGIMEVQLSFTDMSLSAVGLPEPPGAILTLDAFMHYDYDGKITAGNYTVVSPAGEPLQITPGEWLIEDLIASGSYVTEMTGDATNYALVKSGSMDIVDNGNGGYTVTCTIEMETGYTVTCNYDGALDVIGVPGPFSTLTEDKELDLEGATVTASCYGDYFRTGGMQWNITISPATSGGDGVNIEIVSENVPFDQGFVTGTYTAATELYPGPGEYQCGALSAYDGSLSGTIYLGGRDDKGYYVEYAPAMSGDLDIVNNGDGTYEFTFSFLDDKGHTWSGHWSGNVRTLDYTTSEASIVPLRAAEEQAVRLNINNLNNLN